MTAPSAIYRLGRRPDPWQPLDWALAGPDGTFGNRFDDPQGFFRVLYASSRRLGCFLETLARFRLDLSLLEELREIDGDDDFFPLATVPSEWLEKRVMGPATTNGRYADLYASSWVGHLRTSLVSDLRALGVEDLDAATLHLSAPRRLTQRAARIAFEAGFDGVHYRSRYGHEVENWALFEPFLVQPKETEEIDTADPELQEALRIHGLQLTVGR
ncbi:MAG: RES family NAD+ phosphorylase [Bryobacteraceae bacterium]|nr:RES family NAD+ phosphorylase [Bryobacteraceae bacterium]